MNQKQYERIKYDNGFLAALDQSGGSTPGALKAYGINEDAYQNEAEMFDLVHKMRSRIISSPAFTSQKILGAILFVMTMDKEVEGLPSAKYLWEQKNIVPFLKVDKGLEKEQNGVQLMKEIPDLEEVLQRAKANEVFGTKMRSLIHSYHEEGITEVVRQQFEYAKKILAEGLVPIIEPEVSIKADERTKIETFLVQQLKQALDRLPDNEQVILKLSIPETAGAYSELLKHPRVLRIVALSGGFSRAEANRLLKKNHGLTASFSRALVSDLSDHMSEQEFDEALKNSIDSIYDASVNKEQ